MSKRHYPRYDSRRPFIADAPEPDTGADDHAEAIVAWCVVMAVAYALIAVAIWLAFR